VIKDKLLYELYINMATIIIAIIISVVAVALAVVIPLVTERKKKRKVKPLTRPLTPLTPTPAILQCTSSPPPGMTCAEEHPPACNPYTGEWQCCTPSAPYGMTCAEEHPPYCDPNTGNWHCCTPSAPYGMTCPKEKTPGCDPNTGNWCCGLPLDCPSGTSLLCKDDEWGCTLTPIGPVCLSDKDCNSHGEVTGGKCRTTGKKKGTCKCEWPYKGPHCKNQVDYQCQDYPTGKYKCSPGRGSCNKSTGQCICKKDKHGKPYYGFACQFEYK